ncbi:S49 family peptidase [Halomonas halocynthiae]|uniref:S49 family peptidase n=1 Tax=Halomonas halocynthiae TaxID=176290 RepID=UPI000423A86E|nr:S49 family peptidase [Halomonas halocynthiae]
MDATEPHPHNTTEGEASAQAELLREQQRLAQQEMLDRWLRDVLVEQRRSRRWKIFFRLLLVALVLLPLILTTFGIFKATRSGVAGLAGPHLAVVQLRGVIDSESEASAHRLIEGLRAAWHSELTEAVIVNINSPGGSPVQSQRVYDEIMRLREKGDKPIIAVIEDIGASGAYYIASAADEIVAAPSSLVGSIGVISAGFGLEDAMHRIGVERRVFSAGDNKNFLDPFSDISPQQRAFWEGVLAQTHEQFIADVEAGRGDRLSDDPALFSGLVWAGSQALELGLVDRIDTLDGVVLSFGEDASVNDYTPALDPFERFIRQFAVSVAETLGVPQAQRDSPLRYELP